MDVRGGEYGMIVKTFGRPDILHGGRENEEETEGEREEKERGR